MFKKTEIVEFYYDSEQERNEHKKQMERLGYEDSGQVKKNIAESLSSPVYIMYGKYCKYEYGSEIQINKTLIL